MLCEQLSGGIADKFEGVPPNPDRDNACVIGSFYVGSVVANVENFRARLNAQSLER